MLWGRVTYEMMERYWSAVARGEVEAPPAIREWAVKLETKPKYVLSSVRDFPSTPGSPGTARPFTTVGCLVRYGSIWFPRSRSAAARSPCTTAASAGNYPLDLPGDSYSSCRVVTSRSRS
jgi:hypothetical protein